MFWFLRRKRSFSKPVLTYDHYSSAVTVSGRNGRNICTAIENVKNSGPESSLSTAIKESIDTIEWSLQNAIDKTTISEIETRISNNIAPFYPQLSAHSVPMSA